MMKSYNSIHIKNVGPGDVWRNGDSFALIISVYELDHHPIKYRMSWINQGKLHTYDYDFDYKLSDVLRPE